jgi:ligand-binding SRPBCC domain-containing protein
MAKKHRFVSRSQIQAAAEDVLRWHAETGALEKLTPPCEPVEVEQRAPGIRNGDRGALRVPLARSAFAGFLSTATTSRDADSKMSSFPALFADGSTPIFLRPKAQRLHSRGSH